ncbi:MAG: Uma2 family endonuclease [Leptolyngbyaceae cyanobacterium SM1_4_3]|nr:Uma2 family endonuclease [Leptolyngbyaceae cyanobacterium SM1_4_3]NJN92100.1 Uma2 family endonuclease [Leptolyngbyaceae cyanobacterium SL_5_14]
MAIATPKRFTLAEYHRLTELSFFQEDERIELIRGQIIQMAAKGTAHEVCITRLLRELLKLLGEQAILRCQSPIVLLDDSEPEPDFSIVQNREDEYLSAHPGAADVFLVIEISDSSLSYDQETKLPLYAESEISNYWILNLPENCLEAYSEPYQKPTGEFGYRMKRIVLVEEAIALPYFPDRQLHLTKVFPRQIDIQGAS